MDTFYREAGERSAPVVVLLHGFPSSSHMYRNLIPALADRYHVIAPDLPGFGLSEMPSSSDFEYGFAAFSNVIANLLEQLDAERYALYVMDYGAPTGFRLALAHPDRVTALIIQNGNAYEDGMGTSGRRPALTGQTTARRTATRCGHFCRSTAHASSISLDQRTRRGSTPRRGYMTSFSSTVRAASKSSWTSSTTTRPTSRSIQPFRLICANIDLRR
ncbi:alpha/beta hydrolase (plasmid) [Rhizobium gallicum]|nr:alpha/beta hydrolase [Rhizobium gallicum]